MAWQMEKGDGSLLVNSFKQKYFKGFAFVDAPYKSNPSWAWKSILSAKEVIKRGVWHLRAYKKIQIFIWLSLHERIPVNNQLFKRGVSQFSGCAYCGHFDESVDHLLCTCPFACKVLKLSHLRLDFSGAFPTTWQKRWVEMCNRWSSTAQSADCSGLAAFICWSIWKSRNNLTFYRSSSDPFEVAQRAFSDFNEFSEVSRQHLLLYFPSPPSHVIISKWIAPVEGFLKLNFDAAFNSISKSCGGGIILRNHLGQPIKIASVVLHNVSSPSLADSLVLRASLLLLKDWGYEFVVVEGDCHSVQRLQPSMVSL
ncbi:uncharacterized protein LOC132269951 [Cornus florida]|uniref:uncharacterized protein LOC132269951 n=1 Tax=Cornus florida TaxID=4283 RepID=UPI0028A2686C|nr:uncharacterized protein LOC132269951 [Cornus florida]